MHGVNRGAAGRSKRERSKRAVAPWPAKLQSVFLFIPHYLLTVHPANERQYKAVGGDSDISTQAGSLETFELLARMPAWNGLDRGWFRMQERNGWRARWWDGVPGVVSLG